MKKCFYPILYSSILLLLTNWLSAQTITTIAGGTIGDGTSATTIGITSIPSIVTDAAENLYFVDITNMRIRKVDAVTGTVSTIAGNGTQSPANDGGPAVNAGMYPTSMAIDRFGNLYVSSLRTIRKIDAATGIITRIAGNGTPGFSGDGGPAANAQISPLNTIVLDSAGNLYFSDIYRIRKVDAATNIITTICGNGVSANTGDGGLAVNAQIESPAPTLAVDLAGNLIIGDGNSKVIRKIDVTAGIITKIAGVGGIGSTGDGGPATAAKFYNLGGLDYDTAGNLYVTDNNKIRKIDAATGIVNTVIGTGATGYSGDGGNAANATFNGTRTLTFGVSGNLFILDQNNYVIRKVASTTNIITTICGNHTNGTSGFGGLASAAQLFQMNSLAIDNFGNTYIADNANNKIYRIDAAGILNVVAGTGNSGGSSGDGGLATAARLTNPWGITVDATGNFYFIDNYYKVRKVTKATGIISTVAGNGVAGSGGDGGPATAASINQAISLAVDPAGNLYIADKLNHKVRKVNAATGIITTIAGTGTAGYTGDGGTATSAQLNTPLAIAVDYAGDVYVAQQVNPAVRRIDAGTGIITTIAGTGISGYSGDGGPANTARISLTLGLTTDTAGNLFLSELASHIRKVDITTGIINTIAGTNDIGYNGDDIPAITAMLNNPVGIDFDGAGNLLILDRDNFRIRKVTFDEPLSVARIAVTNSTALTTPNGTITRVYPNPAHESVSVSLKTAMQGKATVTLTDIWGRLLIRQQKTVQENGSIIAVLPLHQLAKGIYLINVSVNDTKQVHQLLVQ